MSKEGVIKLLERMVCHSMGQIMWKEWQGHAMQLFISILANKRKKNPQNKGFSEKYKVFKGLTIKIKVFG